MFEILKRIGQIAGRAIKNGFTCAGAIWTALEISERCLPDLTTMYGDIRLITVPALLTALVTVSVKIYRQFWFSCRINDEVDLRIRIGDILKKKKESGCILIGVNDELLEKPEQIGSGSLHRILMEDEQEGQKLQQRFVQVRERLPITLGQSGFPMGTVFPDKDQDPGYLFLVMSKMVSTGIEGDAEQPFATKEDIQTAVRTLFRDQNKIPALTHQKDTLYCPILGTGVAAMADQRADIIRINSERICYRTGSDQNRENQAPGTGHLEQGLGEREYIAEMERFVQ